MAKDSTRVGEIERDLLDGNSLADLLRKCVVLGGRAGSAELRAWASKELRGYQIEDELPPYRVVGAPIQVDAATFNAIIKGQRIGLSDLPDVVQEQVREEVPLRQPVGKLEALVKGRKPDESIHFLLPGASEIGALIDYQSGNPRQHITAIYWSVIPATISGVIDNVRTTLAELVSELVATMPRDQDIPTPEQAHQAVQVAVHGRKSQVTVTTAQSSGESTSAVTHPSQPPAQEPNDPPWWKLGRNIGAFVVGCAIIIGTVIALLA